MSYAWNLEPIEYGKFDIGLLDQHGAAQRDWFLWFFMCVVWVICLVNNTRLIREEEKDEDNL